MLGHADLAKLIKTPVCLDESIESARDAAAAIRLGAAAIINVKPGRVGGYLEARRIHDVCVAHGVPVWCGGMLETGIGRAANVALASLPGFTLPGDTSASRSVLRPRPHACRSCSSTANSGSRPVRVSASSRSSACSTSSPPKRTPSTRERAVRHRRGRRCHASPARSADRRSRSPHRLAAIARRSRRTTGRRPARRARRRVVRGRARRASGSCRRGSRRWRRPRRSSARASG